MNKENIIHYLYAIDQHLNQPATVVIYGSAAFILLDEEERTSLGIDVAEPYSTMDYDAFCEAAGKAGLPVNPDHDIETGHIEWMSPVRLCLARPDPQTEMVLWQGKHLVVKTVAPEDLVASKLIRYDEVDMSDIRYLVVQMRIEAEDIVQAVDRLPKQFRNNLLVKENLRYLLEDMKLWKSQI